LDWRQWWGLYRHEGWLFQNTVNAGSRDAKFSRDFANAQSRVSHFMNLGAIKHGLWSTP
jgi:hypothetical protein